MRATQPFVMLVHGLRFASDQFCSVPKLTPVTAEGLRSAPLSSQTEDPPWSGFLSETCFINEPHQLETKPSIPDLVAQWLSSLTSQYLTPAFSYGPSSIMFAKTSSLSPCLSLSSLCLFILCAFLWVQLLFIIFFCWSLDSLSFIATQHLAVQVQHSLQISSGSVWTSSPTWLDIRHFFS